MKPHLETQCIEQAVLDGGQRIPVLQLLTLHIPRVAQRRHRHTLPDRPLKTARELHFVSLICVLHFLLPFTGLISVLMNLSLLTCPQPTWRVRCQPFGSHRLTDALP